MVPPRAANLLACLGNRRESGSIPTTPLQFFHCGVDSYQCKNSLIISNLNFRLWVSAHHKSTRSLKEHYLENSGKI